MKKRLLMMVIVLGCAAIVALAGGVKNEGETTGPAIRNWAVGETFAVKEQCLYEGDVYECLQAHTVYDPAWTPPNTPALWKYVGPGSPDVPPPSKTHWHRVSGEAVDIGIGANQIYIIGPWDYRSSEQEVGLIWRWNWNRYTWEFFPDNKQARSINVDWQGNPYIVSMEGSYKPGTINRYENGAWKIDPIWWNHDPDNPLWFCPAFDIGISEADSSTHCNYYAVANFPWIGNIAFHYCPTVNHWDASASSGPPFRMDSGPQGYPVGIFSGGQVYRMIDKECHAEQWEHLAGQTASDVAWGTSGIWITGSEGGEKGGYVYRWDGKAWVRYSDFYAYKLDAGNQITLPWVISKSHKIYRLEKN
jgi:hypothetical protein